MNKENLMKKLGKKCLPYLLASSMAFGTLFNYRCADKFVDPNAEKPVARLIAEPTEGDAPLKVNFDGSRSYARAPKSYLEKYLWDFDGDGNTDLTTLYSRIDHVYEKGGNYAVGLIVVDNEGRKSNKALENIVVNEKIISLGQIAFRGSPDYSQDIYLGEIIQRIKDNKIELRNVNRLTTHPEADWEPAWSPDGSQIAFTTNHEDVDGDGYRDISVYIMNADGRDPRRLTPNIQLAKSPYWCANNKIIFTYVDSGFMGVASINPDGTGYVPLFSELGGPETPWAYPSCSPDGSKIAFGTNQDGNWEIYTMNANGSELERLTNHPAIDVQPVFLPDGSGIIFTSDKANPSQTPFDLWLMDLNGSNLIRLTYDLGTEIEPEISPDGKYILFTHFSKVTDRPQLYLTELINADNINKWVQLTTEGGNNYPAWRPKKED